jgi:hypothetical protein
VSGLRTRDTRLASLRIAAGYQPPPLPPEPPTPGQLFPEPLFPEPPVAVVEALSLIAHHSAPKPFTPLPLTCPGAVFVQIRYA